MPAYNESLDRVSDFSTAADIITYWDQADVSSQKKEEELDVLRRTKNKLFQELLI